MQGREKFTQKEIDHCLEIANEYFKHVNTEKTEFLKTKEISNIKAVYLSTENQGSIIACVDGSLLYAEELIDYDTHLMAFMNGLRSANRK